MIAIIKLSNTMRVILSALLLLLLHQSKAQKTEIYAPKGIALNSYDVVEFFNEKTVKGSDSIFLNWKGVKWLFSTQQNRDLFAAHPQNYEPQYGGWCAYGTSRGYKAPTQSDTWTIINNKLYFNYNLKVKELWDANRAAFIDSADAKWPTVKSN